MRWKQSRRSTNVEDRRGRRVSPGKIGGGLGGLVVLLIAAYLGIDPGVLGGGSSQGGAPTTQAPAAGDTTRAFVEAVLGDTEDTWSALFAAGGSAYRAPSLVLFSDAVQSACGFQQAAVGPFYCPADQRVYLDASFFHTLGRRFGAPGDFAAAYVIAHEVGHHVQNLTGTSAQVHRFRQQASEAEANAASVRLELQADCYAGVWAHHADRQRDLLEAGDLSEGLAAASAVGDDNLQQQTQGYVVPESFTHGTSAERQAWFRRGFEAGEAAACDTFGG